jgi:hypothetical protein
VHKVPSWPKTAIEKEILIMKTQPKLQTVRPSGTSTLTLSDHLIRLAEEADRAGYTSTAARLVTLACSVFDEAPKLSQSHCRTSMA